MRVNKILLIFLTFLIIVGIVGTIFSEGLISNSPLESKENVSISVTGDVMFARNMAGVLSLDSSPFSGVSNVTSNVDLLLINFK